MPRDFLLDVSPYPSLGSRLPRDAGAGFASGSVNQSINQSIEEKAVLPHCFHGSIIEGLEIICQKTIVSLGFHVDA